MCKTEHERFGDQLVTADEIAELFALSPRMVLLSPIPRVRVGPNIFRFRLGDVYEYFGADEPYISEE